jgi:6,7-dimethyl-8-ribityllumazine synthase
MLKKVSLRTARPATGRFAIVASRYNAPYVDSMVRGARRVLRQAGVRSVAVVRVPGAYEIPLAAAQLAASAQAPAAILCLGVILRGQTQHAQLIGEAVTAALMQLQLQHRLPVIHEVLLLENEEQARKRCLDPQHNRGAEAAQTALEMARLLRGLARE